MSTTVGICRRLLGSGVIRGDVNRGVQHGCDSGLLGRSLRAVTWDRASGQAVQLTITVIVVAVHRVVGAVRSDIRLGLVADGSWLMVGGLSAVVVIGHATTFVVAARAAGVTASIWQLLPVTCVVMTAMSLPTNIAGWGPREGVTAWMFAAAGRGAGRGVATATVYGVMVLTATLPGLVVALGSWRRGSRTPAPSVRATAMARAVGDGAHG